MDNSEQITNDESNEFSAEALRAAELFERLAPEIRAALLAFLRHFDTTD